MRVIAEKVPERGLRKDRRRVSLEEVSSASRRRWWKMGFGGEGGEYSHTDNNHTRRMLSLDLPENVDEGMMVTQGNDNL